MSDEIALQAKGKIRAVIVGFEEEEPLYLRPASGRVKNSRFCYLPQGIQGSRRQDTMRRTESLLLKSLFSGMMFVCRHTAKLNCVGPVKEAAGFNRASVVGGTLGVS